MEDTEPKDTEARGTGAKGTGAKGPDAAAAAAMEYLALASPGRDLAAPLRALGFFDAPASTKFHLARAGGLAEHSANVTRRLAALTEALGVKWPRPESPYLVGMLHDLVKCKCYRPDGAGGWKYAPCPYPGHGAASLAIAACELGVRLAPAEGAAICHHMGAFNLSGRELEEFSRAVSLYPAEIIATHCADWAAAKIDEAGAGE